MIHFLPDLAVYCIRVYRKSHYFIVATSMIVLLFAREI